MATVDANRFIVVDGSLSSHCCFDYTIVDTHAGKENFGDYWKRIMCECFEKEEAEMICQALNKEFRLKEALATYFGPEKDHGAF